MFKWLWLPKCINMRASEMLNTHIISMLNREMWNAYLCSWWIAIRNDKLQSNSLCPKFLWLHRHYKILCIAKIYNYLFAELITIWYWEIFHNIIMVKTCAPLFIFILKLWNSIQHKIISEFRQVHKNLWIF